jgi:DNA-binding transcriptional MerR regulator
LRDPFARDIHRPNRPLFFTAARSIMRIGDIAQQAGVSTRALRYYEEQGLLSSERTSAGQRTYAESAVERVKLIQQFFTAGLPSRVILQVLPCVDTGQASAEVFAVLEAERSRITAAMADLAAARDALDSMIEMAHNPTPEHCPALRDPEWSAYNPAVDVAGSTRADAAATAATAAAAAAVAA